MALAQLIKGMTKMRIVIYVIYVKNKKVGPLIVLIMIAVEYVDEDKWDDSNNNSGDDNDDDDDKMITNIF